MILSPRTLAVWQIAGGALILVGEALALAQTDMTPYGILAVPSSVAVGVLAIFAGIKLWRREPRGVVLSVVSQCLNLAWVSLPSVQFGSTLGPTLGFRLTATEAIFSIGFYGRGGLAFAPATPPVHFPVDVSVNVLAFIAIYSLVENRRTPKGDRPLTEASPRRPL